MTALETEPLAIRDTDPLHRRIAALDAEQQERLRDLWHSNGLGAIDPLVTTETYKQMERLVATVEVSVTGPEVWQLAEKVDSQVGDLPPNIQDACREALDVYAHWWGPSTVHTTGRLAEAERIVNEAVAYAAEIAKNQLAAPVLPPLDEPTQAEVAATFTDYPGPKAKADEVLAWVGDDRNKAARAYMHEFQDRKPRLGKGGVVDKLTELLGADGVEAVEKAIADSVPPPLDLSSPPSAPGGDENAEGMAPSAPGAGASERPHPSSGDQSVEVASSPLDVEPPAPEVATNQELLVEASRDLAHAFSRFADALEHLR